MRAALGVLLALAGAPAWALSVSLTAPANNAVFQAGATITLSASATPTSGRPITKVEFFRGGTTLIGTDTTSPYSISWTSVPAGSYTLTAKATDSTGATATRCRQPIAVYLCGEQSPERYRSGRSHGIRWRRLSYDRTANVWRKF